MSENYVCESLKFLNIKQCETKGKKTGHVADQHCNES